MLGKTFTATHFGIDGRIVEVEAAGHNSLPFIHVTGLPGEIVRESRDRVRTCLNELGFDIPSRRLVVHLSPASEKKQGSQFDLAIAVAILATEGHLPPAVISRTAFLGELTLDGRVRYVSGALSLIEVLENSSEIDRIIVPAQNHVEAGLLRAKKVRYVSTVAQVIEYLTRNTELPAIIEANRSGARSLVPLLDHIQGQGLGKRALQIALAGRHHLLLMGSPGVGKSMLAQAAQSLMPPLEPQEMVEVEKVYAHSQTSMERAPGDTVRPFRSPHHSASSPAILGGGSHGVVSGELSLAHSGVLFLDELPEFRQDVLEGLREPMQSGVVYLSRVGQALKLPARALVIAAMNPCPCGYSLERRCRCPSGDVLAYRRKLSGPLLDRFGLFSALSTPVPSKREGASYHQVLQSIADVWKIQRKRFSDVSRRNGDLEIDSPDFISKDEAEEWMKHIVAKEHLSFRRRNQLVRVARTIADLAGRREIQLEDMMEAWSFRCPDTFHSPYVV